MPKGAFSDKRARDDRKAALSDENQSNEQGKITDIRARQRAIGRELRRMYDEVAREPIPEDFLELLRQLDARDNNLGNKSE
jgi:hypothetical protein